MNSPLIPIPSHNHTAKAYAKYDPYEEVKDNPYYLLLKNIDDEIDYGWESAEGIKSGGWYYDEDPPQFYFSALPKLNYTPELRNSEKSFHLDWLWFRFRTLSWTQQFLKLNFYFHYNAWMRVGMYLVIYKMSLHVCFSLPKFIQRRLNKDKELPF